MNTGRNFCQNYEVAREDIRDLVVAFRRVGLKTIAAIYETAKAIGIKERRAYRLFFDQGDARVRDEERQKIRAEVIRAHRKLAAEHRVLAAANDAVADAKEAADKPTTLVREFTHVFDISSYGETSGP